MNNTSRTSIIALATFVAGGVLVYGYTMLQPLAVTTANVAVSEPSGHAALADTRAGLLQLNAADEDISKGKLDRAADAIAGAKSKFLSAEKLAPSKNEPLLVAQEALIIHEFKPQKDYETVGVAAPEEADASGMLLTQGHRLRPLALKDYSISFGDLSVDTKAIDNHLDKAYAAAKRGEKDLAANEVTAARAAINFEFNGDQIGDV